MSRVWRTIKGYILWTYERGSFHYDVMVTIILLFIFLGPRFIDFKDKPAGPPGVKVVASWAQGAIYEVEASKVDAQDEGMVRVNFERLLRPMIGQVGIQGIEAVRDKTGHIVAYRAWVRKETQ
jgi:hypothetical protein